MYKDGVKDGDLEKANLGVEAAIWRLKVTVTFKFIHRVKVRGVREVGRDRSFRECDGYDGSGVMERRGRGEIGA